jgi:parvulin-like peptidyl-prolyl isomerase
MLVVVLLSCVPAAADQRAMPSHAVTGGPRPAPREVARVNGVPLMSDRLDAAVNRLIPLESFHRGVNADKMAALRTKALDQLVDEELQYQEGVRLAIRVNRSEVDEVVAKAEKRYPNHQAFEDRLKASGATFADLRREVQRSIVVQKTLDRVVTSQCDVTADEARRFFTANPDRFVVPEQLHLYAITIGVDPSATPAKWAEARVRADDLHAQLQRGASFEEMARKYSTDGSKTTGGDMGFLHRGTLNDEFEQAVRNVPTGHVSDVIKSLYGYHIVRVAEVRPPQKKAFTEIGTQLRRDLTTQRCADMKAAWIGRLRAAAAIVP